jgi:uncharacterized membrane protein
MADDTKRTAHPVGENIAAILRWEEEPERERTALQRAVHAVADCAGQISFLMVQIGAIAVWIWLNSGFSPWPGFDPYPFPLLCLLVTVEAMLLAVFVLIRQNRMMRRAEERNHLALQINLLAERKTTELLQATHLIAQFLGVHDHDPKREQLREGTELTEIADMVRQHVSPSE